jgi:hypothetical protein
MPLTTNPQPLGQLKPGADFATKAVKAIVNVAAMVAHIGRVADLIIQAPTTNTKSIFVVTDDQPPAADYSNVLRELAPGAFYSGGSPTGIAQVDVTNYFVSTQNADDFGFGEIRQG